MPDPVKRVAQRYLCGGFGTIDWADIDGETEAFNRMLAFVKTWLPMSWEQLAADENIDRLLYQIAYSHAPAHPLEQATGLKFWIQLTYGEPAVRALEKFSAKAADAASELTRWVGAGGQATPPTSLLKSMASALTSYARKLAGYLQTVGTGRFTYQGFKIENPTRLPDETLKAVLDGLDYLLALFKRRGVEPLLYDTLKVIEIRPRRDISEHARAIGGTYEYQTRRMVVMTDSLTADGSGRLLKRWIDEVFIHEMGHHVHLSLLAPAAKAEWDKGWEPVEKIRKTQQEHFSVLPEERQRYWKMLTEAKGNFGLVMSKLRNSSNFDLVKFEAWLQAAGIVPPGGHGLTSEGKTLMEFLQDPDKRTPEIRENYLETFKAKLRIDRVNANLAWPSIDQDLFLEWGQATTDKTLEALGIPTGYGRTNEKEDFAETFVWFLVAPEKLSETALYRIKHALSLSGFYGKPIMRVARRWLTHLR